MADIYNQFISHFTGISAWAVLKDGKLAAKVMFKYPRNGEGKHWCYIHWLGAEMVRAGVSGYGYSKNDASVVKAAKLLPDGLANSSLEAFKLALAEDDIASWDWKLREAGFEPRCIL